MRAGRDGRLYLITDRDAPRWRLTVADPADPGFPAYESWLDVLPEDPEAVLGEYVLLDGPELDRRCWWPSGPDTRSARSACTTWPPGPRSASGCRCPAWARSSGLRGLPSGGHEAWFSYTDHATPPVVLHYDARTGATRTWARSPGTVDVPDIRTEQVAFPSADGTTIRMLVISRAGDGAGSGAGAA